MNQLMLGDNLEVLKRLDSESVDLIYLDPPFFSNLLTPSLVLRNSCLSLSTNNENMYNEKKFLDAISNSFKNYQVSGPRSTEKLKPIHLFWADTLKAIFGISYLKYETPYYQQVFEPRIHRTLGK
jgi:16S rRNA G966 N2-methylase RsmD